MSLNLNELTYEQLQTLDDSLEEFIFKQPAIGDEPFSPTFRKDPKTFRKLITLLVAFKRDLMKYFTRLYDNRWTLLKYHQLHGQLKFDQYDDYFYEDYWDEYDLELAQIIEKKRKEAYGLGLLSLALLMGLALSITPEDAQKDITNISLKMSKAINKVTRDRIKKQIEASLKLNESRADFEQRLKNVLQSQTRARLIAENEALDSWAQARQDLAVEHNMNYKTWVGPQAVDTICGSVNGQVVKIDASFSNGLSDIPAHLRCRCSIEYSYDK